jgi:hypothetical protein
MLIPVAFIGVEETWKGSPRLPGWSWECCECSTKEGVWDVDIGWMPMSTFKALVQNEQIRFVGSYAGAARLPIYELLP